ncbi:periodic tryptophan 2-like protein [Chlorella sorokiniana]|uniref:Periodic tryptophan 2-like protein n=1 Tax=Chlorella sorokiniana TaxID=3076 RepID=A0A2P6TZ32_CHLSO|nr:periodic tryptophan 2-like protein [Chlorella sorokiniana]|eukprot:PRW59321.1 periodic tryptophan 2-like protein [Chlorella sorokiniana]
MDYRFAALLGAPYRGGNLLIHDNELLTPVGNRVTQINLTESCSSTLPFENGRQIRTIAVSPDGRLLLSIDDEGRALVVNRRRRALLHHFSFKGPVRAAKWSPDGRYLAAAVGRLLQVWKSPGLEKSVAPMELHRTFGQCHSDITTVDWSADSQWLVVGGKDLSARVFSLNPIEGYRPPTLAGHREPIVAVHFTSAKLQESAGLIGKEAPHVYTLSKDGALHAWTYRKPDAAAEEAAAAAAAAAEQEAAAAGRKRRRADGEEEGEEGASSGEEGGSGSGSEEEEEEGGSSSSEEEEEVSEEEEEEQQQGQRRQQQAAAQPPAAPEQSRTFAGGHWKLTEKHYFNQRGAKLSAADFQGAVGLLAVGFSSGIFELLQLPDLTTVHTLSIGREKLSSLVFNGAGDWIAVGSAKLGQLLVWEWRSETYVLKQQGHYYDVAASAFSPDGAYLVTGADDAKVKVWTLSNGFCFVTFADHQAPVTAVQFLPSGHAVLSASLDGTVRAFDLVRYRNFRTLTTPNPVQFVSLACDPAGEVVCAGSKDSFQIFVWSLKTGRLLDVLAAHEGPVIALGFCPGASLLASGSWDRTVRTWDVFNGKGAVEALQHQHDVLALAWRPDGKQLASSTLDGQIYFWDPHEAVLQGTISGRRDIAGGRLRSDRRTADNTSSGRCFTSLAYSADGSFLLAGGSSKYVCLYDVAERVMLRRFQISHNKSLDGVLDQLNSKYMTDAGPLDQIQDEDSDSDDLLPPTLAGGAAGESGLPGTGGQRAPIIRTRHVSLSPTGRSWAAATTEGLLLYSVDESLVFDPTDLAEDVTPAAALKALGQGAHLKALLMAMRLNDPKLTQHVVLSTPRAQVSLVVNQLPPAVVPQLLTALGELLPATPHIEYLLSWAKPICVRHGAAIQAGGSAAALPALRSLQKALTRLHEDLAATCEANQYALEYITTAGQDAEEREVEADAEEERRLQQRANGSGAAAANGRQQGDEGEEDSEMEDVSDPSSSDEEDEDSDE